jgi:hypothetical protein
MKVYQSINAIQSDLSKIGISKDRSNVQQGYKFRGIDDVFNALSPLLAKHALCILPRVVSRDVVERSNAKGTALFYVTVCVEFDFVSSEDDTKHTVITYGEAMDSGDKATNKAMSAAYKYACMQAFSIPTEGDNDADSTTHEVKSVAISPVKEAAKLTPISEEAALAVSDMAADMFSAWDDGMQTATLDIWRSVTDNDMKIHLWGALKDAPKIRSFIKANSQKVPEKS